MLLIQKRRFRLLLYSPIAAIKKIKKRRALKETKPAATRARLLRIK
jgi:hypothetical protein